MSPQPVSGYAYTLKHSDAARSGSWSSSANNDDWDVAVISPSHTSNYMWVGRRRIDGSEVNVWDDAHSRRYIAQTTALTGRLQENQGGAAGIVLGVIALGGLVWWFTRPKEVEASAPAPQACPITLDILASYMKTKPKQTNYKLYVPPDKTQPVATWGAPKPDYLANPNEHSFSLVDCGFYKWDGTKWVSDDVENAALAKFIGASTVKGAPMFAGHPANLFMI